MKATMPSLPMSAASRELVRSHMCSPPNIAIIFRSIGNQRFMRGKASIFAVRPWPIGSARQVRCSNRSLRNYARTSSPAAACMATIRRFRCWSLARARQRPGDCGPTLAMVALGATRRRPPSPTLQSGSQGRASEGPSRRLLGPRNAPDRRGNACPDRRTLRHRECNPRSTAGQAQDHPPEGGGRAAAILSLIETAKRNGLDPKRTFATSSLASPIIRSTESVSYCRGTWPSRKQTLTGSLPSDGLSKTGPHRGDCARAAVRNELMKRRLRIEVLQPRMHLEPHRLAFVDEMSVNTKKTRFTAAAGAARGCGRCAFGRWGT